MVSVIGDGDTAGLEEGEEARLTTRVHAHHGSGRHGTGTLVVTTRRVLWIPEEHAAPGALCRFSLYYQAIAMHAICRDTSDFEVPCVYLQLDAEQDLGRLTFMGVGGGASAGADGNGHGSDHQGKRQRATDGEDSEEAAGGTDDDGDEGEAEADDEYEHDATWQEMRLVPAAADGQTGGPAEADASLEAMYAALCECAALNPDEGDEGNEDEDDGMPAYGAVGDAEALLAVATSEQLSMLERYDRTIEPNHAQLAAVSHPEPRAAAPPPRRYDAMLGAGASDGRFDDAEGEGEGEGER